VPGPAPQSESVELVNELVDLHRDEVERLRQLRFRLGHLVRSNTDDQAARVGLAIAAFRAGEREQALKELHTLKSHLQGAYTPTLTNLVPMLVMTGQFSWARTALEGLKSRTDWPEGRGADPATVLARHVILAHGIDAPDVARSLANQGDKARRVQETIDQNGLQTPLARLGQIWAEVLARHACDMDLIVNVPPRTPGAALFFIFRLAEPDDRRDALLTEFDCAWERALIDAGWDPIDMDDFIAVDVLPLPAVYRVQA